MKFKIDVLQSKNISKIKEFIQIFHRVFIIYEHKPNISPGLYFNFLFS